MSIIQPFAIYHHQKGVYVFLSLYLLGGGFKYYYFHPYLGTWSNLTDIFQMGWNHQLVYI